MIISRPAPHDHSTAIIYLAPTLLLGSCCLPFNALAGKPERSNEPLSALIYVALQHTRFTHQLHCCNQSWALTSRFHPYPQHGWGR